MQQNRSQAGEIVRGRYCAGGGWRLSDRAYRPKPRREEELLRLVRARVRTLRREGRANERVPVIPGCKRQDNHRGHGMEIERSNRRRASQSGRALSRFALSSA